MSEETNELRDKMAIAAMKGIISEGLNILGHNKSVNANDIAQLSYEIADAMLLERSKGTKYETMVNEPRSPIHNR